MASIQFREDVHRDGVFGPWSAVVLPNGSQCSALRLPIDETDEDVIERVVQATQTIRDLSLAGVAPVADVIVGGGEVWLLVAMPSALSIDDLIGSHRFTAAEIAVIATDVGKTIQALHHNGLAHGALAPRAIVLARSGAAILTEAGLAAALADPPPPVEPPFDDASLDDASLDDAASDDAAFAGAAFAGAEPVDTVSVDAVSVDAMAVGAAPAGTMSAEAGWGERGASADPFAGRPSSGASAYSALAELGFAESPNGYGYDAGRSGGPAPSDPVPSAELTRADIEAWCDIVIGLADLLRVEDDRSVDAEALDRCARRARNVGLASGLHALGSVARRFPGFPSRASLSDVVRARTAGEATLANIMGGIDALFAADADASAEPSTEMSAAQTDEHDYPAEATTTAFAPDGLRVPAQVAPTEQDTSPVRSSAAPTFAASSSPAPPMWPPASAWPPVPAGFGVSAEPGVLDRPEPVLAMSAPDVMAPDVMAPDVTASGVAVPESATSVDSASELTASELTAAELTAAELTAAEADPYPPDDLTSTGDPSDDAASPSSVLLADRLPAPVPPSWTVPLRSARAEELTVRLGPGVPTAQVVRPTRLGRRRAPRRLLLNAGLALAIIASLIGLRWWSGHQTLHVKSVSVRVEEHVSTGCALDADIIGTISTSGGSGVVTYRWRRNDGTTTDTQTIRVGGGAPAVVHLRWSFTGYGQQTAGVALVVVKPQEKQAETSFIYRCVASG